VRFTLWVSLHAVLLVTGDGLAQGPGLAHDPWKEFEQLSGGKAVWVRAEITKPWLQGAFDQLARQMGVRDGRITREQYLAHVKRQSAADDAEDRMAFQAQLHVNRPPPPGLWEWEQSPAGAGTEAEQRQVRAGASAGVPGAVSPWVGR